jgi:putative two-component system response regulator
MNQQELHDARILIADDQEANVRLLEGILRRVGYTSVRSTTDSRKVLALCAEFQPDLILLDLVMPHIDGFHIMEQLQARVPVGTYLPVLVLTADITQEARQRALSIGARDFVTKPFDHTEVILRIKNLLETRFLHRQLRDQNETLAEKVLERTVELEEARLEVLKRLAIAAEYRDDDTGRHTQRVGHLSALLARALKLPEEMVVLVHEAAPLHDVGKIGIPDSILLKPGKLSADEFEVMKTHTVIGAKILSGGHSNSIRMAAQIALTHHERWDGSGYPHGLAGEAVPVEGRIVAVVDVFDALTNVRPYKSAWNVDRALAEIRRQKGTQFDPCVVEAFLAMTLDLWRISSW